jgi:hypothetical protein
MLECESNLMREGWAGSREIRQAGQQASRQQSSSRLGKVRFGRDRERKRGEAEIERDRER